MIKGMNLCGYDVANIGEADFRFGESFFAARRKEASFAFSSANLLSASDKAPYAAPFVERVVDGAKVIVVGVVGDSHTQNVSKATAVDGQALSVASAAKSVQAAFAKAGEGLRVVLAHMSVDDARALIKSVKEVDLVIAAHGRNEPSRAEQVGDAVLVGAGHNGRQIGRLDLQIGLEGLTAVTPFSINLDDSYADDAGLAALYKTFLAELKTKADELAKAIPQKDPTGGGYVGVNACKSCHPKQVTQWEGTRHAHAWNTLVLTNHDYALSCFGCHSTGYGFKTGFTLPTKTKELANVQCETCHGPAGDHVTNPQKGWSKDVKTACVECHQPSRSPNFDLSTYLPKVTH